MKYFNFEIFKNTMCYRACIFYHLQKTRVLLFILTLKRTRPGPLGKWIDKTILDRKNALYGKSVLYGKNIFMLKTESIITLTWYYQFSTKKCRM